VPRVPKHLKAEVLAAKKGRGASAPGGVVERGTHGRDDPVNWEILAIPLEVRRNGAPVINLRPELGSGCLSIGAKKSIRREVGRRQGEPEPRPMVVRKSEGPI
jgi:hypothetical protein